MRVLALDLGHDLGWATRLHGRLTCGTLALTARRHEGAGMAFLRFQRFLGDHAILGPLDLVAYEAVARHVGTHAAHVYGGYWGHLIAWCEEAKVPFVGVPVGTIKRLATGKGNATKEMMLAAARKQWPAVGIADDNQADALWLLHHVESDVVAPGPTKGAA